MASLNSVHLMGNITRDPEIRYTPGGDAVSTLGLAVNKKFSSKEGEAKEQVLFIDVEVWKKVAENCVEYLNKGSLVLVTGELVYRTWDDKDGAKRNKISVTAFNVQFLPSAQKQTAAPVVDSEAPF